MDDIRIIVADDHPLYREGVARILSEARPLVVVGQAGSADEAVEVTLAQRPEVVLLDLSMPGGGISALRRIVATDPAPKVVMLTVSEEDEDVLQALKAGASGYVLKGVGGRELVSIVKDIAGGRSYVSPSLAARILNSMRDGSRAAHPVDDLTSREEDILRLVAQGLSNKEVGSRLDLQEKTVKHYMTAILQKLQVRNRTEAALMARERWKG